MLKLSIITVNYNNRKGLKKTISSVLNQTFTNFEYIIIDGGSSDGSTVEIELVAENLAYWASEPDKGIFNAMNKGINKATGEYCLFMNSGDCFTNNEILNTVFSAPFSEDIVFADTICVNMRLTYPNKISLGYLISKSLPHQSTLIKKSLFEKVGLYNENNKIISDWEFSLKAIHLFNCTYKYLPGMVISRMELPGHSMNRRLTHLKYEETRRALITYFIPILENKLQNNASNDDLTDLATKFFDTRDSKLVRLALKFEESKLFYFFRKVYYHISKS